MKKLQVAIGVGIAQVQTLRPPLLDVESRAGPGANAFAGFVIALSVCMEFSVFSTTAAVLHEISKLAKCGRDAGGNPASSNNQRTHARLTEDFVDFIITEIGMTTIFDIDPQFRVLL